MSGVSDIHNCSDCSFLASGKIQSRKYQINIANKCINRNSLVVLPTGLGKTIIAVLVTAKSLEIFPDKSKVVILAPTRPLINQHYNSFLKTLTIQEDTFAILTGKIPPTKRTELFETSQILFFTPQTLRNDIINDRYNLKDVCLIIFDEAHHATGEYPYTLIADEYIEQNPDGNILALTASPGATKKKITKLCLNLHVPLENIHIRSRKDEDVKTYLKPMDIYKIGVNLTSLMKEMYSAIQLILEERLQYLSHLNFLDVKAEVLHEKVIRKDLLKLNKRLTDILKGTGDKTGVYSAISINAQALILYHMLELIEQQGLDILREYLESVNRDAKKKNSSKAIKILASNAQLRQVFIELKKNEEYFPEKLIHPKYEVLKTYILEELSNNPASRILVFVKLRNSVRNIVNKLQINEGINPIRFVGQASKSKDDKGLSQNRQIEILEQFKNGIYNVLVATNVAEEGLDIAECDLVIFYDVVASEIRLIQRKGRTARHRGGKVVILYCKDTHDEIYLRIALNKLKKMNINLKNPKDLRYFYENKKNEDETHETNSNFPISNDIKVLETPKINSNSIIKKKKQSNLQAFMNGGKKEDSNINQQYKSIIKLSSSIPMKFGLRKKLHGNNIPCEMLDLSQNDIILNRVLVQIHHPREFFQAERIEIIQKLKENYELVIIILDFVDFKQIHEGEKRHIKERLIEYSSSINLQTIAIDNSEELFFIVKNIYEQSFKGENEKHGRITMEKR